MTTAGTPGLNKPVTDNSEAQARNAAAIKEGQRTLATFDGRAAWSGSPYRSAVVRMIEILEDR